MFEFLASISNSMDSLQQSDSDLVAMYRELLPQIEVLKEKKRSVDLRTRAGFLKLYDDYLRVDRLFRRFDALYIGPPDLSGATFTHPEEVSS